MSAFLWILAVACILGLLTHKPRRRRSSKGGGGLLLMLVLGAVALAAASGGAVTTLSGSGHGGSMTAAQVESLWVSAGGPPSAAQGMAAIAYDESGDEPGIVQQGEPPGLTGWGLWQITPTSGITQNGQFGNLLIPLNNARAAVYLFSKDGYGPWSADPAGKLLCGC